MVTGDVAENVVPAVTEVNKVAEQLGGQEVLIATVTDEWAGAGLARALRGVGGVLSASRSAPVCDLLPQSLANVRKTWMEPEQRGLIEGGHATLGDWLARRKRMSGSSVATELRAAEKKKAKKKAGKGTGV